MPLDLTQLKEPWRILLFGKPKAGKTYSYVSFLDEFPNSKMWVINTDNGFLKTLKNYYGHDQEKLKEVGQRIEYHRVLDLGDTIKYLENEVLAKAEPDDIVVFDLISDFWEFAQDEFAVQLAKAFGGDVTKLITQAAQDKSKFQLFSGIQWQYIKKLDNMIVFDFLGKNPPCNVIGVAAEKDLDIEQSFAKMGGKKPEYEPEFEEIGKRPAGQKQLGYKFDAVFYLFGKGKVRYAGGRYEAKEKEWVFERSFAKKLKEVIEHL